VYDRALTTHKGDVLQALKPQLPTLRSPQSLSQSLSQAFITSLSVFCSTLLALTALAPREAGAVSLDQEINALTKPVAAWLTELVFYKVQLMGAGVPLVVIWLVAGALFFTFYLSWVNLRGFKHAIELVRGDFDHPESHGEVSHFQALATAVSGTVGIGNIGGVAVAVTLGGPGATFWLIMAGVLGMSTKFVECTLSVKYRDSFDDGHVSGGPMYYLNYGLKALGMARLGRALGAVYAVGILLGALGIGNLFQSNQAYEQLSSIWGDAVSPAWVGLTLALLVLGVILGGIKSIARVTEKVVPFMAVLYCASALTVIALNAAHLPEAILSIFTGAFSGEGVAGGALGVMVIGFQRAVFSNEAGIGSASIAHSAVKTDEPVTEGVVALLEPFIDTIVICTITALVITTSQLAEPGFAGGAEGVAMTSAAFARHISWFPYPLAFAAVLFALSTMISWSYYGLKGWSYLFGEGERGQGLYKLLFCFFVFLGPLMKLGPILEISDALVFLICIPNILGLYLLAPTVKREMESYFQRIESGEIKKYKR